MVKLEMVYAQSKLSVVVFMDIAVHQQCTVIIKRLLLSQALQLVVKLLVFLVVAVVVRLGMGYVQITMNAAPRMVFVELQKSIVQTKV
jgi:hypothetical protein